MGDQQLNEKFKQGQLFLADELKWKDPAIGAAIASYANAVDINRASRMWRRALGWTENIFFGAGKQYVDDILISRLSRDGSSGDTVSIRDTARNMPRPVNDFLGRYVETNLALLTENRPRPRVTAKSDRRDDMKAAELSELTMEYLWEALQMPEKHRELARLILYCGTAWLEIDYDELTVRHAVGEKTEEESSFFIPSEAGKPVNITIPRRVRKAGKGKLEYGDITANVISPFEMHLPMVHYWNGQDMGWILREYYTPILSLQDKYGSTGASGVVTKKNGWNVDALEDLQKGTGGGSTSPQNLPLWWFERLTDLVEGPGPSLYVGTPETWSGYTVVRVFDRRPCPKWPNGRTVMVAGENLLYDSPMDRGARAFDPRWPQRWHPYIRYHWESMVGSIYARSLVSKLLPKIKRVNNIDTALIMYRRAIPIASWICPKGCWVPGTYVTCADGTTKAIETFDGGESVQSFNSINPVVKKVQYSNDEMIIRLKSKGHLPILGTAGHVIPVIPKSVKNPTDKDIVEKRLMDIEIGDWVLSSFKRNRTGQEKIDINDYVMVPANGKTKPINSYIPIDTDFLRLIGLFLAEGCVKGNKKQKEHVIQFTVGVKEQYTLAAEIVKLMDRVFGIKCKIIHDTYGNGERLQIQAYSTTLAQLFKSLCKTGASQKQIHPDIFTSPISLLPLVGGWIDGDGCSTDVPKSKDGRRRTWKQSNARTISINLAYQMRGILLDEKIVTSLYSSNKNRNHDIYSLIWDTTSRRQLSSYCNKFKEDTAQKTCRQDKWVGNCIAVRVKETHKQKYIGPVYDLEISNKHYYQANGIIVHNTAPVEDFFTGGQGGQILEYDPRRTNNQAPQPIFPPPFPEGILNERTTQIAEMESIAGTEQILRGERPIGVNSASMLDVLRKQALASRSAILQAWDESLQDTGSALLQETIKNIGKDKRYAERIRLLARERGISRMTIEEFSGSDLQDNVIVRVDTASLALVSKEARQQRALEFMQYAPSLSAMPTALQQNIIEELGFKSDLNTQGPDIDRAKSMLLWIKNKRFDRVIPFPEDNPYIFHELFVNEMKDESYFDWDAESQQSLIQMIELYQQQIELIEKQQLAMQQAMMQAGQPPK